MIIDMGLMVIKYLLQTELIFCFLFLSALVFRDGDCYQGTLFWKYIYRYIGEM